MLASCALSSCLKVKLGFFKPPPSSLLIRGEAETLDMGLNIACKENDMLVCDLRLGSSVACLDLKGVIDPVAMMLSRPKLPRSMFSPDDAEEVSDLEDAIAASLVFGVSSALLAR